MIGFRLYVLAGLLTGGWGSAVAQRPVAGDADTGRIESVRHSARWVVSLSPLALLDPENTVQVGAERLLAGRHSVLGELGYGPKALNVYHRSWNNQIRETWRGRAEWRIYARRSRLSRRWYSGQLISVKPVGNYTALDVFYKQVNAYESGSVGRACDDGTCQYFQRFEGRVVKYVGGAHLKVGRQAAWYALNKSGRLVVDTYIGLGVRRRTVKHYALPEPEDAGTYTFTGGEPFDDAFFRATVLVRFSVAAGFRIGYVF